MKKAAKQILEYIDDKFYLYLKADLKAKDYNKIVSEIVEIMEKELKDE